MSGTTSKFDIAQAEEQIYELRKTVSYDIRELTIEIICQKYKDGLNYDDESSEPDIYNVIYVPEYQRDFTWDQTRQSRFIESVILGLPIPLVFVAENIDGSWEIVDGSQRIRTLNAFLSNNLRLTSLEKLDKLNSFVFQDLEKSRRNKFVSLPMRMIVLSEDTTDEVKKDMFERINRGSDLLKPMEKRKGIYIGPFRDFIYYVCAHQTLLRELAPVDKWLEKRQEREELVLRFFALSEEGSYAHFPAKKGISKFLDDYLDAKNKKLSVLTDRDKIIKLDSHKTDFINMLCFVKKHFDLGFRRTHNPQTKRSTFEAISVGVHMFLKKQGKLPNHVTNRYILNKLNSPDFKQLTTGNTSVHNPAKVKARVEYIINMLSGQ